MKKTKSKPEYEYIPIYSLDEIPTFENEDAEREFWWTHEVSDELHAEMDRSGALADAQRELDELRNLPPRTLVNSLAEIPEFQTDREEREWWSSRQVSDELFDATPEGSPGYKRIEAWAERSQRERRRLSKSKSTAAHS
jgi:hypothetical protein